MKNYNLEGVKTYEINLLPDERGFFAEALRTDWNDLIENQEVEQINLSFSYPNIVRAWHKHLRGQIDHFLVIQGAMKICAYEEITGKMVEIIVNAKKPTVVRIPGKYFHGTKTISNEPSLLVYFVNKLYNYKDPDEIRINWDDSSIVPIEINGKKTDPRVGKSWDWFKPPHK
ncbi:dTDP-4-dehydrorhamnose 3,5-epimerase family protein [Candidatus Bathyarchaeota archaeon]|nr:dTDP-4-dehydrorhamnose 3,5-epimerase family protein [Candidatus Bathyarchaeota archaeon]